jgi:PIN domain nuclease of toxin-antitoxin system
VVSVVTLWEVALLHDDGHVRLPVSFSAWCDALEATAGLTVTPLVRGDVEEARALAMLRDPHDRLIAGTAIRLGIPLISADQRLPRSGVRIVWDR